MFNEKEIKWAVKKLYEMFDEDDRAEVEELMEMEIEDFFPDLAAALYSKLSTNHEYRMENNIGECMSYYGGELFGQRAAFIIGFSLLNCLEFFVFRKMKSSSTINHPLCGCESNVIQKKLPFRVQ